MVDKIMLEITNQCNRSCRYCYNDSSHKVVGGQIELSIFQKVIEQCALLDIKSIIISGGEPLMVQGWEQLVYSCAVNDIDVYIYTNGTFVNEAVVEVMKNTSLKLQISLDAVDDQIHDFNRGDGSCREAKQAIEFICSKGFGNRLTVNCTFSKKNIDQMEKLAIYLSPMKIRTLTFNLLFCAGRGKGVFDRESITRNDVKKLIYCKKHIVETYPSLHLENFVFEGGNCGLTTGHWAPVIRANGDVFPCSVNQRKEDCLGNVLVDPIEKIIERFSIICLRAERFIEKAQLQKCNKCNLKGVICKGGCYSITEQENENLCDQKKLYYALKLLLQNQGNKIIN